MSTLTIKIEIPYAEEVHVTHDALDVDLSDGRSVSVPLAWYPRLVHSTEEERKHWRLIGKGSGIHWEELDEDISIEGLLAGRPSSESQSSLKKWLEQRKAQPLEERVFARIKATPGQIARDMASDFGVNRKAVSSVLYGKLNGLVWRDKKYRWYPKDQSRQ